MGSLFKKDRSKNDAAAAAEAEAIARRLASIANAPPPSITTIVRKKPGLPEREHRKPVFRLATLFTAPTAAVRCIVHDISDSGARVVMEGAFTLPPEIVVKFDYNGELHGARIAWQENDEAGMAFMTKNLPFRPAKRKPSPAR